MRKQLREELFFLRGCIVALLVAVAYLLVPTIYNQIKNVTLNRVHAYWRGDTLLIDIMDGPTEVFHFMGTSESNPVIARLPKPLLIVDSESVRISYNDLKQLRWESEARTVHPAPPVGSEITVLYRRFEYSQWRPRDDK